MTDPVFALEPDIPRNVRIARWLLFRLLSGANLSVWRRVCRIARRSHYSLPQGVLAGADRGKPGGGGSLD